MKLASVSLVLSALAGASPPSAHSAPLMNWPDLTGRPLPSPDARIAYGPAPDEFVEAWTPAGKGPFPVVLMVHGGCWRSRVARCRS